LSNQVCLVTGAASGIGQAISRRLASEGAAVTLCDINEAGIEAAASDIASSNGKAMAFRADASSLTDMASAVEATVRKFGALDAMFNNAGIAASCPLEDITAEMFTRVMTVNAYSVVVGCQVAGKYMKTRSRGSIINTCSVAGKRAFPGHTLYAASKFAIRAMTQGFSQELAPHGVRVNAICPGMIRTPLWDEVSDQQSKREGVPVDAAALVNSYAAGVSLGRPGTPADLTGIAVFLVSSDSDYLTGQCINVDGGLVYD
jgi:meso-butanediol dehydrogenase/(S,S)-butanediol dehydrogenase/diacetyl reductase